MKRLQGIRKFLQKVRSASGQELSAEFSLSLRRLRDHLRALECLTSYSHKRSFYALPATARFDKHRIWKCRRNGALFTDLGSLGALVEWHVRQSPSGLTCRELSQIVGVRVEPQIVRISREHGLIRQKFDGEFVYFCRANEKVYRVQVGKRGRCSRSTGAGPARVVDSEVDELQRDLQIALALLNHPRRAVAVTVDTLRRKGVNVSTRDVTEFLVRYDVKKKHVSLEVIQLDLLFAATRLQAALSSRNASRAIYCLLLESSTTHCPRCGNLLCVIKTTTPRSIKSIRFGLFWVKERLKACQACGDARVWRSEVLPLVVPSRRTVAYDVMVFAGEQKLLRSHTLEAIQKSLAADYELSVSLSLLSLYVQEFCYRFECLHFAKLAKLARWTKKQQLGYMLHVDCSSERKSDTVFVAYDRTSEIVLISEKVPSERMPFLVPVLKKVKAYMGNPISAMSDLGLPIMKSIEEAFPGVQRRICHFHLLRDVGKDILDPDYADLRAQINQSKINAKLNALERDVLSTHSAIDASRISAKEPLLRSCGREEYLELEPVLVLHFVRSCRKLRSCTGLGYPFDLPWVRYTEELCRRALEVRECIAVLRHRRIRPTILKDLDQILTPFLPEGAMHEAIQPSLRRCLSRERQFVELRKVMRFWEKRDNQAPLSSSLGVASRKEIVKFNEGLRQYRDRLRVRLSSNGHAFHKKGYQIILKHIEKYWGNLILHPTLWRALKCQVVDRTNNIAESGYRGNKQLLRKTAGRCRIEREYSDYGAYLPLISNLKNDKYVERVLGEYKNLSLEFAQLDSEEVASHREKFLEAKHGNLYRAVRTVSQTQLL